MKHPERFQGKTVVSIVCGRNIGTELFKSIITRTRRVVAMARRVAEEQQCEG